MADLGSSLKFGFRRRCAWCGVVLRGWQLNRCRLCKRAGGWWDMGDGSSFAPCQRGSRWESAPDRLGTEQEAGE